MLQSERNFFLFSWNSWKHNYENDVITSAVGNWYTCITKTWKIPKKYSEAVKGRTDITVAKRKHTTQKCIKDWATRTLQIPQNELGCRGRVGSTSDTRRVSFWTKLVISHAKKNGIMITTKWTFPWSCVTHKIRNG
jgi:hypothetical protein